MTVSQYVSQNWESALRQLWGLHDRIILSNSARSSLFSLRTQMVRSDLSVFLLANEKTVVTGGQPIRDCRQLELRVSSAQFVLWWRAGQSPQSSVCPAIVCTFYCTLSLALHLSEMIIQTSSGPIKYQSETEIITIVVRLKISQYISNKIFLT